MCLPHALGRHMPKKVTHEQLGISVHLHACFWLWLSTPWLHTTAAKRDTVFGRDYQETYPDTEGLRYALEYLEVSEGLRGHRSYTPDSLPLSGATVEVGTRW